MIGPVKDNPKLIVTEIADPHDSHDTRFVELYSSDSAGKTLGQIGGKDVYLVRWTNAATEATASTAVKLTGLALDADGFLVLCKDAGKFKEAFGKDSCVQPGKSGGPVDSNGDDHIAIVKGEAAWNDNIIDIFGKPGTDGTGQDHEFEDGRAERKAAVKDAKATWAAGDWNVDNDSGGGVGERVAAAAKCHFDPYEWIGTTGEQRAARSSAAVLSFARATCVT